LACWVCRRAAICRGVLPVKAAGGRKLLCKRSRVMRVLRCWGELGVPLHALASMGQHVRPSAAHAVQRAMPAACLVHTSSVQQEHLHHTTFLFTAPALQPVCCMPGREGSMLRHAHTGARVALRRTHGGVADQLWHLPPSTAAPGSRLLTAHWPAACLYLPHAGASTTTAPGIGAAHARVHLAARLKSCCK
jgi:hypothetical protein